MKDFLSVTKITGCCKVIFPITYDGNTKISKIFLPSNQKNNGKNIYKDLYDRNQIQSCQSWETIYFKSNKK